MTYTSSRIHDCKVRAIDHSLDPTLHVGMNLLTLKELEIHNFKSWRHLHLRDIPSMGLTLLCGGNGAGKSGIRQAIEYLLLDTTSDDLKLGEIPRDGNTDCLLKIVLDKNGDEIIIEKHRGSGAYGNQTFLSINGDKSLTQTDRRETQKIILNTLGVSTESLFVSTLFSSQSPSFCSAKEPERKKVLYDVLDLQKFNKYYDNASQKCNDVVSNIRDMEGNLDNMKATLSRSEDQISRWSNAFTEFSSKKKADIANLIREMNDLEHIDLVDIPITKLQEINYNHLMEDLDEVRDKINSTGNKKIALELKLEEITDGNCPLLNESCDRLLNKQKELDNKYTPELSKINKKYLALLSLKKELISRIESEGDKERDNKVIEDEISKLKSYNEQAVFKNKSIDREKNSLKQRAKDVAKEANPYEKLIEEGKKDIRNNLKEMKIIKDAIKESKEELEYFKFWKEGFSKRGLPNLKSDSFLESLEDETNNILNEISDRISVRIESQSTNADQSAREKISYKISHPDKSVVDYNSYSGGERQRIRLADMLAFQKIIGQFSFVFLDEVLELSLDNAGKDEALSILKKKAKEIGTMFVISHDDTIKDAFDNVLNIHKTDGVSELI